MCRPGARPAFAELTSTSSSPSPGLLLPILFSPTSPSFPSSAFLPADDPSLSLSIHRSIFLTSLQPSAFLSYPCHWPLAIAVHRIIRPRSNGTSYRGPAGPSRRSSRASVREPYTDLASPSPNPSPSLSPSPSSFGHHVIYRVTSNRSRPFVCRIYVADNPDTGHEGRRKDPRQGAEDARLGSCLPWPPAPPAFASRPAQDPHSTLTIADSLRFDTCAASFSAHLVCSRLDNVLRVDPLVYAVYDALLPPLLTIFPRRPGVGLMEILIIESSLAFLAAIARPD